MDKSKSGVSTHQEEGSEAITALGKVSELECLASIFDNTRVFLGLLDAHGVLIRANRAALQVVMAEEDAVNGRPFCDGPWWSHDPAQQEILRAAIVRAARGEDASFEAKHINADGTLIYVDFKLYPVRNEFDQVAWLVAEGRDISAHRALERKLASERAILRTLIDSIPDLIFYKDCNSVYLGCNKAVEKFLGRPESQIVGRTDFYFQDNETAAGFRATDQQVLAGAGPILAEHWVRYPDGSRVLFETLKAPIRSTDGKLLGVMGVARNISESHRISEALRKSEERYRQLFENVNAGFVLLEILLDSSGQVVDFRYLEANPLYEKITGLKVSDLIGRTALEATPDVDPEWVALLGKVALTGEAAYIEDKQNARGRWCNIRAFSPQRGYVAVLLSDVTERHFTFELLHRQQAQLRAILDNFPFMVWLKDSEGRYLDVNQAFVEASGCESVVQLLGKTDFDIWPEEQARFYADDDRKVMQERSQSMVERPAWHGQGWQEAYKTPILDGEGKLLGTAGFARDITQRKLAADALTASQSHYQALLDASPVGVFEMNAQGVCVYVNQRYSEITGISAEVALQGGWVKGVYPDDLKNLMQIREEVMAGKEVPNGLEYRHLRPDGGVIWVMGHGAVIRDANQKITGLMLTLVDITERKEMENRLRLSASMYESSSEGIMVLDADNRIVSVNPAFGKLLGYESAEVIGQDPIVFGSERNTPSFYHSLWHTVEETGHWQGEIWYRRKDRNDVALWMTINTLRNRRGEVQWRFALFSDITERKHAEEVIWRQANYDMLTGLPNRRLFRDRLQQEVKKAERSGRMLALFFIDLDHFKEVNDSLGHDAGDWLLVEAGARICSCLRDSDTVSRMGGDEFTAILPELTDDSRVNSMAQSIIQALQRPFLLEGVEACVSASIGVAVYPHNGLTEEMLLKQADRAMYFAKARGKNCYSRVDNE